MRFLGHYSTGTENPQFPAEEKRNLPLADLNPLRGTRRFAPSLQSARSETQNSHPNGVAVCVELLGRFELPQRIALARSVL